MSNFLRDIEITNFKSIRHQKIEGCKRINVFIGYPNVGKSNILEALSLFGYSKSSSPKLSSLVRAEKISEVFCDGNVSEPCEVIVNGNDKISLEFLNDTEAKIERKAELVVGNRWAELTNVNITLGQELEVSQNPSTKIQVTTVNNPDYSFVNVKKYHYRPTVTPVLTGYKSLYFPCGENLFYILETNPSLRKDVAEIFREYQLKLAFEKGEKYSLKILKTLQDDTIYLIPFHQIADTLQRLIFYKAAIASNQNSVLLFEEPEAHMFPPYISKFTADVMFGDSGNQFFINTHSPLVISDFMENLKSDELSIYVVGYKKSTGETVVRKLTDNELSEIYQYGIDLYYNLETYLEHED